MLIDPINTIQNNTQNDNNKIETKTFKPLNLKLQKTWGNDGVDLTGFNHTSTITNITDIKKSINTPIIDTTNINQAHKMGNNMKRFFLGTLSGITLSSTLALGSTTIMPSVNETNSPVIVSINNPTPPLFKVPPLLSDLVTKKVDEASNSVVVPGNKSTLLKNGVASFPERWNMIKNAKRSISIQSLLYHSDVTGKKFANLLAEKAKEGVKVRIILDWTSCVDTGLPHFTEEDKAMFKMWKDTGVELQIFNAPLDYNWHKEHAKKMGRELKGAFKSFNWWTNNFSETFNRLHDFPPYPPSWNKRWHMKILSVDGEAAIVGGMNFGSEYENGGTEKRDLSHGPKSLSAKAHRDTDIKVEGPVVRKVDESFAENWAYVWGSNHESILTENPIPKPVGNTNVRYQIHQPREKHDQNIENWYYEMLKNCEKTAYITNCYFLPTDELKQALIDTAKRGVDTKLILSATENDNHSWVAKGARYHYQDLLENGVKIYEYNGEQTGKFTAIHTKNAVFDSVVTSIGAHNLDPRSFFLNSENAVVVEEKDFGQQADQMFKEDLAVSQEITLADIQNKPFKTRLEEWFAANILKSFL